MPETPIKGSREYQERLQYIREHGCAPMGSAQVNDSEYHLVREYDRERLAEEWEHAEWLASQEEIKKA